VTVIAAGFDGGAPVVRRDARGLGQVSAGRAGQAPAAIPPSAAVPTTTAAHAAVPPRPVNPDEERAAAASDVPAFLSPDQAGTSQLEVPRIFEEEVARRKEDDLDVPDFLK
jgi:cell division protein FtsZ